MPILTAFALDKILMNKIQNKCQIIFFNIMSKKDIMKIFYKSSRTFYLWQTS